MKFKKIALILSVSISTSVYASGIPTVDVANLVPTVSNTVSNLKQQLQQYEGYLTQLKDLKAQYDQIVELKHQLETAKETLGTMSGKRNLSKLLNNPLLKKYRGNLPGEWKDGINILSDTAMEGSSLMSDFEKLKSRQRFAKYLHNDEWEGKLDQLENYQEYADKVLQSEAIARVAFDTSEQGYENAEEFIEQIDHAEDIKASADLTNRLLAENLVMQNKILQLQASLSIQNSGDQNIQFERRMQDRKMADMTMPDLSGVTSLMGN